MSEYGLNASQLLLSIINNALTYISNNPKKISIHILHDLIDSLPYTDKITKITKSTLNILLNDAFNNILTIYNNYNNSATSNTKIKIFIKQNTSTVLQNVQLFNALKTIWLEKYPDKNKNKAWLYHQIIQIQSCKKLMKSIIG